LWKRSLPPWLQWLYSTIIYFP